MYTAGQKFRTIQQIIMIIFVFTSPSLWRALFWGVGRGYPTYTYTSTPCKCLCGGMICVTYAVEFCTSFAPVSDWSNIGDSRLKKYSKWKLHLGLTFFSLKNKSEPLPYNLIVTEVLCAGKFSYICLFFTFSRLLLIAQMKRSGWYTMLDPVMFAVLWCVCLQPAALLMCFSNKFSHFQVLDTE